MSAGDDGVHERIGFGELLRSFRSAAGLSQEVLAERAGISVAAVGLLERGKRRAPHRETLSQLARALELTGEQLSDLKSAAMRAKARRTHREASAGQPSNNLPTQLTSFIGREADLATVELLLSKHRLVTIVGSGGVGKTRLALEVASRLFSGRHDEAWFIDLAPLGDGDFIISTFAATVARALADREPSIESVVAALKGRNVLLVLDNCEHLTSEVAAVARLILQRCPDAVILATSREKLAIAGEATYRLPSLPLPEETPTTVTSARSYAAIDFFVQRAEIAEPAFILTPERIALVAGICRQLGGIPLAIELAVARLPTLGLTLLQARLDERFLLSGVNRDLPPRQQTMVATIAWSVNLLAEHERVLLRRLAVFAGGFRLEAAEAVCTDEFAASSPVADLLTSLVDKSLVDVAIAEDTPRYSLLGLVRSYAVKRLAESGESSALRRRHAEWLANFADEALVRSSQLPKHIWLSEITPEMDNVRSALEWTLGERAGDNGADAATGARIVVGLRSYWLWSLQLAECGRWVQAALETVDEAAHPLVVAQLLLMLSKTTRGSASLSAAERALPLLARAADRRNLARLHADLAYNYCRLKRYDDADAAIAAALTLAREERMQRSPTYASLLLTMSVLHSARGLFDAARADIAKAQALGTALGDEYFVIAWCTSFGAEVEFCAGNTQGAATIVEAALASKGGDASYEAVTVAHLADLAVFRLVLGETELANSAGREVLRRPQGCSQFETSLQAIQSIAAVAALRGGALVAARLLGFVDAACEGHEYWRSTVEQRAYDILTATVTDRLSGDIIATLRAGGATLTHELAIDEALAASGVNATPA